MSAIEWSLRPGAGERIPLRARAGSAAPAREWWVEPVAPALWLLAAYGLFRWQTMLPADMRGRFAGMLAVAIALSLAIGVARRLFEPRVATVFGLVAVVVAVLAMIPLSGLPLEWTLHLRAAVTVRAIRAGIAANPSVTVPYDGGDRSTAAVIALAAGMLLVMSVVTLASVPGRGRAGSERLLLATAPLIFVALLPSVIVHPRFAYLHGLALFGLLVLILGAYLSDRIATSTTRVVIGVLGALVAGAAAIAIAHPLMPGRPWVSFDRLTSQLGGVGQAATFNWTQTYGPLSGPGSSNTVLEVRAQMPSYWKTEDLDEFDGLHWVSDNGWSGTPVEGVSAQSLHRWTQQVTVQDVGMRTSEVVGAGMSGMPGVPGVIPGGQVGTWVATTPLVPGQTYSLMAYTPKPSAKQLGSAGTQYPSDVMDQDLSVTLSLPMGQGLASTVQMPPYTPHGAADYEAWPGEALSQSPLARVQQLANRLVGSTATPYQYVLSVMRYLGRGYKYVRDPPRTADPIPDFLFQTKRGYCQQFAGAMALLLRLGGVPARVAVGFTTGTYNASRRVYDVSSADAHAWVEAWFPGYGWVTFDPTPSGGAHNKAAITPADAYHRSHQTKTGSAHSHSKPVNPLHLKSKTSRALGGANPTISSPGVGGTPWWVGVIIGLAAAALLGGLGFFAVWARRRRQPVSSEALVRELERAFARCGRPLRGGVTLAQLERRFAHRPEAVEYVARLRRARFAGSLRMPSAAQRRAVRACLVDGLGPLSRARALFALPPRFLNW